MIINIEKIRAQSGIRFHDGLDDGSRARTCVVSRLVPSSCPEVDDGAHGPDQSHRAPNHSVGRLSGGVEAVCHDSDERCADSPNDSESLYHCNYPLKELFSAALLPQGLPVLQNSDNALIVAYYLLYVKPKQKISISAVSYLKSYEFND